MSQGGPTIGPPVAQFPGQGGSILGPGVAQKDCQGGPISEPLVAQKLGQSGSKIEPPSNANSTTCREAYKENAPTRAHSTDFDIEKMIDRLQNVRKEDFDDSLFETGRQQIASHHAKFCRPENRLSSMPDDVITSQFLSVAEWPRLTALLSELASERKEAGYSYGWYVTVALQRIHGLSPESLKAIRTKLKREGKLSVVPRNDAMGGTLWNAASASKVRDAELASRPKYAPRSQPSASERLKEQIRTLAAAKRM